MCLLCDILFPLGALGPLLGALLPLGALGPLPTLSLVPLPTLVPPVVEAVVGGVVVEVLAAAPPGLRVDVFPALVGLARGFHKTLNPKP